jgi:hypothetical protein
MSSTHERRAVSFRSLAWVGLIFTVLSGLGAWVAYRELIHYRRCAVEHLPADTQFLVRLDVEQVVLFDPVRRHLLPLLERLPLAGKQETPTPAPDRLARLREAGLNLGLDLREVLFASTSDRHWVLVLGGLFPRTLLPGIERALRSEASAAWTRVGNSLEFVATGAALGQAADGALILASDRAALEAALPSTERYRALSASREGAGGLVVLRPALGEWVSGGSIPPWLDGVERVGLSLRLRREIEIEAHVQAKDAAAAGALAALIAHRPGSSNSAPALDPKAEALDPWGLMAHAQRAEVSENTVEFANSWRQSEIDRGARELAAWLERRLSATTPSPS